MIQFLTKKEQCISVLIFLFCNAVGKFKVDSKTEISHLGGIAQEKMIISEMVKMCWFLTNLFWPIVYIWYLVQQNYSLLTQKISSLQNTFEHSAKTQLLAGAVIKKVSFYQNLSILCCV